METVDFHQILILLLQCFLVSTLLLVLFRIRSTMGIGLLYTALGLFQFMQVFLASTIYIQISKDLIFSPGSTILFTGSLFTVLIIYIKEDALETRKVIYALVIANIIMSFLLQSFSWNVEESSIYNPYNVSTKFFENNSWVLFIGTITLFIDSILLILIYEFISKLLSNLFLRIYLTMLIVLSFDTICFSLGSFWNSDNLHTIILSGLISKTSIVVFYSIIFSLYLKYIDKDNFNAKLLSIKDVFYTLTYRQKFEIATKEIEVAEKEIQLNKVRYETLANVSPVGIFLTGADGNIVYVNPKWSSISGLPSTNALGRNWLKAVHPNDRVKIKKSWNMAILKKENSYTEYRFQHSDGSIAWVLSQIVQEYNNEKQLIGYIGTITDITDLKLYEQELNNAKEKAEESDRIKTAFLQNVSHEIRTPMNAIYGFSELLNQQYLSDEKRLKFTKIIMNSSDQLLSIITNILTLSALETLQEKVNPERICINNVLEELHTILKKQADKQNISLYVQNQLNDKEAEIYTDKTKLIQILTNLLNNALKFTHEGFVKFGYNLKENELEFYVTDTGLGIPLDQLEKIFERFGQVETSTFKKYGGTGLGLSISKGFTELLGGEIWVKSEFTKGSTFYFTIPYNPVFEVKNTMLSTNKTENQPTILIAEDEKFNFLFLKDLLKNMALHVIHAKDGKEAVDICRKNSNINLVLMDIKMPIMNGQTAAKQIKKFRPELPIIAQTAYVLEYEIEKHNGNYFDDYITKPINASKLKKKLSEYIDYRVN